MGRRQHRFAFVIACAAAALTGCGGDDPPPNPVQQCEDFVGAWCNKNAECSLPSERARVLEDCRFVVQLDVRCDIVKQVGVTYPDCIDDIKTSQCLAEGGIEFPGLCTGVLIR